MFKTNLKVFIKFYLSLAVTLFNNLQICIKEFQIEEKYLKILCNLLTLEEDINIYFLLWCNKYRVIKRHIVWVEANILLFVNVICK